MQRRHDPGPEGEPPCEWPGVAPCDLGGWNTVEGVPFGSDAPKRLTVCWIHFGEARWIGWRVVLPPRRLLAGDPTDDGAEDPAEGA